MIEQLPRLLGLLDRNVASATYGCFDRQFWQYRTVDFAGARYQEAALSLALAYKMKGSPYYKNDLVKRWIAAAIAFWTKIQEKDGSFNEWYPNEKSFVATAFSTCAVSEILLELPELGITALPQLIRAADWLAARNETRVFNQQSGAALALYNVYLLTKKEEYKIAAKKKIDIICKGQNVEGWWYEYEGPDFGYLSLMIDYLTKYYKKARDKKLVKVIEKATDFLSYFVHPDGSVPGVCGSRNTEYLIPSGFRMLGIAPARAIAAVAGKSIGPAQMDDRYLAYVGYNWLYKEKQKPAILPCTKEFTKSFPNCGLYIQSTNDFYVVVNGRKGGAFSVFAKKTGKRIQESGVLQKVSNGYLSNGRIAPGNSSMKKNEISVASKFYEVKKESMSVSKYVALRAFQATAGKSEKANKWLKATLRDVLISKKAKGVLRTKRTVIVGKTVQIIDEVRTSPETKKVVFGEKFAELYVPSSQYFQVNDLNAKVINVKPRLKEVTITREVYQ